METCWNVSKSEILTDPRTRATYNFGGATGVKHAILDVVPWIVYGTGRDDPYTFEQRFSQTVNAGFERFKNIFK